MSIPSNDKYNVFFVALELRSYRDTDKDAERTWVHVIGNLSDSVSGIYIFPFVIIYTLFNAWILI